MFTSAPCETRADVSSLSQIRRVCIWIINKEPLRGNWSVAQRQKSPTSIWTRLWRRESFQNLWRLRQKQVRFHCPHQSDTTRWPTTLWPTCERHRDKLKPQQNAELPVRPADLICCKLSSVRSQAFYRTWEHQRALTPFCFLWVYTWLCVSDTNTTLWQSQAFTCFCFCWGRPQRSKVN